jgi:hypothetical protein
MRIPVTSSRPRSGSVPWLKHSTLETVEIPYIGDSWSFHGGDETAVKYCSTSLQFVRCHYGRNLGSSYHYKQCQ